jgi:alkanesulfonate monooxygenase SsuD/methylene tetrahydromethanopterin reductase-like flavin-dependent oxidoreductase (luciferase family)
MQMKYGILLTAIHDASTRAARQRREHEELVRTADELGFELMVAGQHFLGSELRYYQPIPWLAHMAQVAPSMRVATGIILLSMVNPVDMAEQIATLDALTDGRAIFGVGLGYSAHEFDAFRVGKGQRVKRFEEALELIKLLWSGKVVDFDGDYTTVRGAKPSVLPVQEGGIPIWVGGQVEGAVRRAALMGDAWYAPPFPTHDQLAALRALYLRTREEAGLATDGDFPARRELLIAPDKSKGMDAALERYRARYETYRKWGLSGSNTPIAAGAELRDEIESHFILGTSEECAGSLIDLEVRLGLTHFLYKPHWVGQTHAEAMRQLELFGTEVMPLVAQSTGNGSQQSPLKMMRGPA